MKNTFSFVIALGLLGIFYVIKANKINVANTTIISKNSEKACGEGKIIPEWSTFFSTAYIEQKSYDTPSDGDLWPATWSDDGNLYAANGDGKGFDLKGKWADIVVNQITGHPGDHTLKGRQLTSGNEIGSVWGDTSMYNRKPTGMLSRHGILYLAVQNLNKKQPNIFSDAPSATILRSDDKGVTWHWNRNSPMFKDHY